MMPDTVTNIGNSIIQHGPLNNRIYLMHLSEEDGFEILPAIDRIAIENGYSKIFAKVPISRKDEFEGAGYRSEAYIPRFFNGIEGVCFMAKYSEPGRAIMEEKERIGELLRRSCADIRSSRDPGLGDDLLSGISSKSELEELASVFGSVFSSYPFPIDDPDYIGETMDENVFYFHIIDVNTEKIVSVSSAEMDYPDKNVEMTNFATLPEYQGNGFAAYLLRLMEDEMKKFGIKTAYTIARSLSYPMNRTFANCGYKYSGTLTNNTHICGNLESMNVWYRFL